MKKAIIGWTLGIAAIFAVLIAIGSALPESTRSPGESVLERNARFERDQRRVKDSIAGASEICSRNFPGRTDLWQECLDRLVKQIPPARY
jgi:hypothetical protein